jgi:hypothetical protein
MNLKATQVRISVITVLTRSPTASTGITKQRRARRLRPDLQVKRVHALEKEWPVDYQVTPPLLE